MILTSFNEAPRAGVIFQGIYDIFPVIFFLLGSIILLRTLYGKMVKGCYCLLAAGSIMVFNAGVLKALHKIIMGVFSVDYVILDKQFTPTQSIGFILLFLSLIGMFTFHNIDHIPTKTMAISIPCLVLLEETVTENGFKAFTNLWPFLSLMILGAAGYLIMLSVIFFKMKRKLEGILFILAFFFMIGMGYLSTKRGYEGAWMQISCNVIYQGIFFVACLLLKKHGLENAVLFKKKEAE